MNKLTTVYDVKTGEPITLEPVDARERLQAGLATAKPPEPPAEKTAKK